MDIEQIVTVVVGATLGSGGVIAWLKLRSQERADASTSFISGHDKASEKYERDLQGLAARMDKEREQDRKQFARETTALRNELRRTQQGLRELVEVVLNPEITQSEQIAAAVRIVASLNLPPEPEENE